MEDNLYENVLPIDVISVTKLQNDKLVKLAGLPCKMKRDYLWCDYEV